MNHLRVAIFTLLFACAGFIGGCGQGNSGDDAAAGTAAVRLGLDRFLLFPNPIVDASGNFQTNTNAFAQAYYAAVDPYGERGTLSAWMSRNQFGTGGPEFVAVFRDVRDLGYGRRMRGRRNTDGSIAFFVENYNVSTVPGGYSLVNVDAAVVRDTQWHVGTNAIEWSPAQCTLADPPDCAASVKFSKYFNFDPATGQRQNMLDLDGRGQKAMPGVCISCHGGRADPLTPQSTYALVENSLSRKRGDVQARLQGFDVDSFEWSMTPGFTRADQESVLKIFNQWVLCSYPGGGSVTGTWGMCNRPLAGANEWQGTAATLIQDWYGGSTMPNAQFSDAYLPAGWNTGAPNVQLYRQVVAPFCRTCHLLRGTANQSDIDFDSEVKFRSYASRIKTHVFDRGNMPLAFLVFQDFWKSNGPAILANYIDSVLGAGTATTSSGAVKQPGRPIADPGPNRMVRTGANATLYGGDSLFATSYSWTLDSATPGATITNPDSATATFFSSFPGNYTVHLTVSNRGQSDSKAVTVTVDNTFRDPATLKFAHVKNVLQTGSTCTTCHIPSALPQLSATPPIWYTSFDRNNDTVTDATDDAWFYSELMGRVNLTEISDSSLLRKPTGNHHNGGSLFDLITNAGLSNYSIIYNWILNGAPSGGVAANAGADSSNSVTFSGSPLSAGIALDGSQSLGPAGATLTYSWSIAAGPNGPTGAVPSITNANAAAATLNVTNIGTYVVQLQVSDGTDTDTSLRTITVSENAITATFTPATGSVFVTFSPSTGNITLTSTSSGGPTICRWQVTEPGGVSGSTLDSSAVLDVTKSCGIVATLNVPSASIGVASYSVTLTASNIGSSTATHTLTVSNSAPTANLANTSTSFSRSFTASATNFSIPTNTLQNGTGTSGSVSAAVVTTSITLDGSASTTPVGTLTYSWCVTNPNPSFPASISSNCASMTSSGTTPTIAMTVTATGTYDVQLRVDNGSSTSTVNKNVTVNPTNGITFATIAGTVGVTPCSGCHIFGTLTNIYNTVSQTGFAPPWNNANTQDGATLYQRLRQRVNLGTPTSSLLLVCPNAGCGGMGAQATFSSTAAGTDYDNFLKWIQDGAPPN